MAKILQFKRYNSTDLASITGAPGELIVDLTKKTLTVHDGTTAGGEMMIYEGMTSSANVPNNVIRRDANGDFEARNAIVDGVRIGSTTHTFAGAASTITNSNLTANRALISNGSGKVAVSAVTSTELSYLDGVTSAIQTQLNGKAASSHTHSISNVTGLQTALDGKVGTGSAQALHSTDALRISGQTVSLYKGDGTSESITIPDASASVTTSAVLSATAGAGVAEIGTYVFAYNGLSGVAGETFAGSSLSYYGVAASNSTTGVQISVGTWRLMGHAGYGSLYLRIS